jgi:hypothetical protein
MTRVVTVFRSGGDFLPQHVQALRRMVWEHSPPGTEFVCLSDTQIRGMKTLPLFYSLPGFWAKMELFAPWMIGDFLFMDLDTVILGPIDDFLKPRPLTTFGGALMWLPEKDRMQAWKLFNDDPKRVMREYGGEDVFLRAVWAGQHTVPRTFVDQVISERKMTLQWHTELPGQLVFRKYRGLLQPGCSVTRTDDARIVIFSGLPRPWHTKEFGEAFR